MSPERSDTIVTLSNTCILGKGCKLHTHYEVWNYGEPITKFTIFGKEYATDQWGNTFQLPHKDYVMPHIEKPMIQDVYASDTITPSSSLFLVHPKPYQRIEIKPKTVVNCDKTIDASVMGLLLSFTILLTAYWFINSITCWVKLFTELRKCLSYTS